MKSYFKRFIVVCFTLIIIFVNISSFYYVAYADNQSSGGHFGSNTDLTPFNKLYDGFDFLILLQSMNPFIFLIVLVINMLLLVLVLLGFVFLVLVLHLMVRKTNS